MSDIQRLKEEALGKIEALSDLKAVEDFRIAYLIH